MSPTRCLFLCVLFGLLAGACLSQEARYVPPKQMDIAIGNYKFFDILTPAAGYTVEQRQRLINQRLIEIFAAGRPGPVTISPIRGKPTIFVNGIKLVTVYPRDVQAAKAKCAQALAAKWAARIAAGLPKVWPGCLFGNSNTQAPEAGLAPPPPIAVVGEGK